MECGGNRTGAEPREGVLTEIAVGGQERGECRAQLGVRQAAPLVASIRPRLASRQNM
jgi:hypothetical protein